MIHGMVTVTVTVTVIVRAIVTYKWYQIENYNLITRTKVRLILQVYLRNECSQ